jgi:hypothetical protein
VDVPNRTPVIESIAVDLPAITEVQLPTTSGSDFPSHMLRGSGTESVGALTVTGVEPYNAEQVEKQVEPAPGNLPPRYPDVLRSAGVEGQVIAQFVVDAAGKVEEGSLRFIRGDNVLFEDRATGAGADAVRSRRSRWEKSQAAGSNAVRVHTLQMIMGSLILFH